MNATELSALRSAFGRQLTTFQYFKDQYALQLVGWAAGEGLSVAAMKRGSWASLLQKDLLKQYCARHATIRSADLDAIALPAQWAFTQSLDAWGGEDSWDFTQTSRPGMSLVLRLDFPTEHDRFATRLRLVEALSTLQWRNHMRDGDRFNLAWSRLDIDFETGEVLIEEIQNDWLRTAQSMLEWNLDRDLDDRFHKLRRVQRNVDLRFQRYHQSILMPLEKVWAEAMLSATLAFVRDTLGLHTVYMHTPDCGARLKGITYSAPPRSLYQDLPRKFCFRQTTKAPVFLSRAWGQMRDPAHCSQRSRMAGPFSFWKMEL